MTIPRPHGAADREAQQRLEALGRDDKWYLSASDGFLWAPAFPRWMHRPGFWDAAQVFDYTLMPLFTVALVTEDGASDPLERVGSDWRPDRLRVRWRSRTGLALTEFRYVLPGGRFCSAWRTGEELGWPNPAFRALSLVAHTSMPGRDVRGVAHERTSLSWATSMKSGRGSRLGASVELSLSLLPPRGHHPVSREDVDHLEEATADTCGGVFLSEGGPDPDWDRTPFVECWHARADGRFRGEPPLPSASDTDIAHLALVLPLDGVPARYGVCFVGTIALQLPGSPIQVAGKTTGLAPRISAARWRDALRSFPRFRCSDPFLSGYHDYRIYNLHLNRLEPRGLITHPCFAEGIGSFHTPAGPAAACHARETRWAKDPAPARGSLLNFVEAQREDGSMPARLFADEESDPGILWTNWADAALAINVLHPDPDFLDTMYGALSRLAYWVLEQRDPEGSGLITVADPSETGKEYSARFPDEDPVRHQRFKGVVATVFTYRLFRALELLAQRLGREQGDVWRSAAVRISQAMLGEMWDPEAGLFFDVDGAHGQRTGVRSVVCFYPLLTDVPGVEHIDRLLEHLRDPAQFAAPFPVPSLAMDDPRFSAEGLWNGERYERPWNGRVWPSAASHLLEGLLRQWRLGHRQVGPIAADMLRSFVQMMHFDGDAGRPNAFEHYNPLTGHASVFRGIDDHLHDWVGDLLVRGVTGVQPEHDSLIVDPLPFGLESASFRGELRGHTTALTIEGDAIAVDMDGHLHETTMGNPLQIPW